MIGGQQVTGRWSREASLGVVHQTSSPRRSLAEPHGRQTQARAEADPDASAPRYGFWLSTGLLAGGAAALITFSVGSGYLLGQIAGAVLALAGLHGLWRGGLRKLLMLPVSCGLVFVLAFYPGFPDPVIVLALGRASPAWNVVACVVVVLSALMIAGRTARVIRSRVTTGRRTFLTLDHLFGAALGIGQGLVVMLGLCWATVLIEPQARAVLHHRNLHEGSACQRLAAGIVQLTREINETPIESIVHEANLLERVPSIRDALYDLADGQRLTLESMDAEVSAEAGEVARESGAGRPDESRPEFSLSGMPSDARSTGGRS